MCPVCFSSVAWLITGGVSVLGATAGGIAIVRDRKIATRISRIWKLRTRSHFRQALCLEASKTNAAPRGSPWTRGACRGCDRRIHRNPATLVTPWPFDICISICT
jgi:hypothetical protein